MAGTTYKLIRSKQADVIEAFVPTLLSSVARFRRWRVHEVPFENWCEEAGDGGFRTFEIQHGGDYESEGYLDKDTVPVIHTEEVLVGYPQLVDAFGFRVEEIWDQDKTDIAKAIGILGYADYDALGTGEHVCRFLGSTLDDRPNARILRLRFSLSYDRSLT